MVFVYCHVALWFFSVGVGAFVIGLATPGDPVYTLEKWENSEALIL